MDKGILRQGKKGTVKDCVMMKKNKKGVMVKEINGEGKKGQQHNLKV